MLLLLPGRHHLLTTDLMARLTLLVGERRGGPEAVDALVWAITSANHQNTRRNPLPGHRREAALSAFAEGLDAPSFVYHIDDVGESGRFADYILKKVEVDSFGRFRLVPADTLVATGTPELAVQFQALGFRVVADGGSAYLLLEELVRAGLAGEEWERLPAFLSRVHRASRHLIERYGYARAIVDLHRHPVGTDDGDLTATRDYNVYVRAFDDGADRKAALVRDHLRPGRIVDVGCCTGSLIQQLTRLPALRESDFYGIELARPLYEECLHRKRQGAFGSDHVFFYQANVAERPLFAPNSVDTFTTFSLTHELESYQGRAFLLRFMGILHEQLAVGGRWLNADVVGPEGGDEEVRLWLRSDDGAEEAGDPPDRQAFRAELGKLSTRGRFLRFARDFRAAEGYRLEYRMEGEYAVLSLRDACEFLSKKDYLDNWRSEMHEAFCFWSFADWTQAVQAAGFAVLSASRAYANPWIVENRYEGKAALFRKRGTGLERLPWPPTNMLLVAEKR
ncbi:MAG: methyltransferase domain-containing protein [Gemmataceae bacterium]|nr:methyltransferase domain-containing protein [Gemmataceae bacterium]